MASGRSPARKVVYLSIGIDLEHLGHGVFVRGREQLVQVRFREILSRNA